MSKKRNKQSLPVRSGVESKPARLPSAGEIILSPDKSLPKFCLENYKLPCPLGASMFSDLAWREIARKLRLSGQELRVVRGVFDDLTEFAIAAQLGVSPHTVHTHCERLHRKIGVTDRVKLVLRVMEEYVALTLSPGSILPPLCAIFASGRCPLRGGRI